MADPVSEQILDKVRHRLTAIKTSAGFELDVSEVVRPSRFGGFRPQHLQLVVTLGGMTRNTELSHPGNPPATAWDMEVVVAGLLMPPETFAGKIDALRAKFAADTIKAICTPAASWHNWDSLAILSELGDIEDVTTEESSGFRLPMTVTFRVDEGNPYTVRS
jgi:hypothetical protein